MSYTARALVGYRYINGQIVIVSNASGRKVRNIKRNNDVTVLVDAGKPLRGILIYGKAELDYDNVHQMAVSVYVSVFKIATDAPRDRVERFTKAYLDTVKCVIIKVTPERMLTFDYAKDDVYSNLVKTYILE